MVRRQHPLGFILKLVMEQVIVVVVVVVLMKW